MSISDGEVLPLTTEPKAYQVEGNGKDRQLSIISVTPDSASKVAKIKTRPWQDMQAYRLNQIPWPPMSWPLRVPLAE